MLARVLCASDLGVVCFFMGVLQEYRSFLNVDMVMCGFSEFHISEHVIVIGNALCMCDSPGRVLAVARGSHVGVSLHAMHARVCV